MRLDALFTVKNGVARSTVEIVAREDGALPFIRPASTQPRTIGGWVRKGDVSTDHVYPVGSLYVSTNGEGSHSYAYVSTFEFVPNSDVSVLIPKRPMTFQELVFYARCITMNRYRFSCGRKPKGERLKSIELPDEAPSWVGETPRPRIIWVAEPGE